MFNRVTNPGNGAAVSVYASTACGDCSAHIVWAAATNAMVTCTFVCVTDPCNL